MGEEDRLTNGGVEIDSFPRTELKRDHQCLVDDAEPDSFPNKKQAKEFSNEDIRSEVSNPVVSPKENGSSFQDITSQPAQLANSDRVECGEVTSSSSEEESLSVGQRTENDNGQIETDTIDTTRVVVEIPKPSSSSGIRKITFKFSKRKEDYENQSFASASQTVHNGFGCDLPYGGEPGTDFREMAGPSWGFRERSYAPVRDLESNKVPDSYPNNVKKLLATGILDGARVKYVSTTSKVVYRLDMFINFSLLDMCLQFELLFVEMPNRNCMLGR